MYRDSDCRPVFFEGTDPRHRGLPSPRDESEVGTPREQWERALERDDPATWVWYSKERKDEVELWADLE